MLRILVVLLISGTTVVVAFTKTSTKSSSARLILPTVGRSSNTVARSDRVAWRTATTATTTLAATCAIDQEEDEACFHMCPEPENDLLQDRREAVFAGLGALWAVTGVGTSILFSESATAEYGVDAKMELPNPYQQMADRASKQCLVESLGSRECLVYENDAGNKLYQGLDSNVLMQRIGTATTALTTIPALVDNKQWSKVTGVLTGPMGELMRTMGQLSATNTAAQGTVKLVKKDLYAMADAVSRKDGNAVLKYHTAATNDLAAFVKALE